MQNSAKAQVSVEFLILFSVTLLTLLVFMSISQSESADMSMAKEKTNAMHAVQALGAAAEDVYAQGKGAKKKVLVEIPFGYDAEKSLVQDNAIKLHAAGNDFVEITEFEVYGYFPQTPGRHEVWIESEGGRVRIGSSLISVDREAINLIMGRNDTRSDSFTVSNLENSSVAVHIASEWDNPEINMVLLDDAFVLPETGSDVVTVTFSSAASASDGFYTGLLNITGNNGAGNSEHVVLPLTVEISHSSIPEGGPPLVVLPSFFNATLKQGESETKTFQVCTNSETTLSSVEFTPSENWPGSWVGMTEPLPAMRPGICMPKGISVAVPEDASTENWKGYVYLTGHGAPEPEPAEDVIVLNINVERKINESDAIGPLITEVAVFPSMRKIFVDDLVAVRVTADDRLRGGNAISGCELKVDGGSWISMDPSDGSFDEPLEYAGHVFFSGFSMGEHPVAARCTDSNNNTGPEAESSFVVIREFLFVTQDPEPKATEQAWMDWLDTGMSDWLYAWDYDAVDSAQFMNNSPNLTFYATVVAERWVPGMEARLNSFESSGGSVVMLGHALEGAPMAFGVSNSSEAPANYSNLNFYDGSHYITHGIIDKNKISGSSFLNGRFSDFSGDILVSGPGIPAGYHMLGISGKKYFWGPTDPSQLNEIGENVTTRLFDHALNASANG